jgi:hypothetical protein
VKEETADRKKLLAEIGVEVERAQLEIKNVQYEVKKCSYNKEIDFNRK